MKNIEIEAKYKIDEKKYEEILDFLMKKEFKCKEERQHDIYFSPQHFPFLGGQIDNECLRIRVLDTKNILSYKKFVDKTEDKNSYCIEHEIEIEDIDTLTKILNDLRIDKTITIKKERKSFYIDDLLEVSLDDVDGLGKFVELEIKNEGKLSQGLNTIKELTEKFMLSEDMRDYEGYSYLLYEKYKDNL